MIVLGDGEINGGDDDGDDDDDGGVDHVRDTDGQGTTWARRTHCHPCFMSHPGFDFGMQAQAKLYWQGII